MPHAIPTAAWLAVAVALGVPTVGTAAGRDAPGKRVPHALWYKRAAANWNEARLRVLNEGGQVRTDGDGVRVDERPPNTPEMPPDLAQIAAAWPHLPEAVKAGILGIITRATGT